MKNNSKEFYEVMDHFEKTLKEGKQNVYVSGGFLREKAVLWNQQCYYCNGEINRLFIMFVNGYSYGKCVERMETGENTQENPLREKLSRVIREKQSVMDSIAVDMAGKTPKELVCLGKTLEKLITQRDTLIEIYNEL